jgi:hypothetical protein
MNYALDTEFNGFGGSLMSIALVPFDTSLPSFYRVVEGDWMPNWDRESLQEPWVQQHVTPFLYSYGDQTASVSREVAARDLSRYLSTQMLQMGAMPTIVADWPTDFSQLFDLFILGPGKMVGVPDFNVSYRSLRGFNTADHSKVPHNALADAEALRDYLVDLAAA